MLVEIHVLLLFIPIAIARLVWSFSLLLWRVLERSLVCLMLHIALACIHHRFVRLLNFMKFSVTYEDFGKVGGKTQMMAQHR